jgi:hypothetical protein
VSLPSGYYTEEKSGVITLYEDCPTYRPLTNDDKKANIQPKMESPVRAVAKFSRDIPEGFIEQAAYYDNVSRTKEFSEETRRRAMIEFVNLCVPWNLAKWNIVEGVIA